MTDLEAEHCHIDALVVWEETRKDRKKQGQHWTQETELTILTSLSDSTHQDGQF